MSETTLADIERLCWHLSGWQVDQRGVDELLRAVTAYAGYGPDQQPGEGMAPPPGLEGGEGEAVHPPEALPPPDVPDDTPEPANGPQGGVQRLHVTGTLTLVCPGPHVPAVRGVTRPLPVVAAGVAETERECRSCALVKPLQAYSPDPRGVNGRRRACRDCENARKRQARAARRAAA